jgi:hypothetical protein
VQRSACRASLVLAAFALASAAADIIQGIPVDPRDGTVCAAECTPPARPSRSADPLALLSPPEPPTTVLTARWVPRAADVPGERTEPAGPVEAAEPAAPPTSIGIASLGVQAPVDAVGLLASGGMAVPDDADRVGWFAPEGFELAPGDAGTAVLAGHRDSRRSGPGALHRLADVQVGDRIVVQHADGRLSHWQVERSRLTLRDELPVDELFTRSGAARLAVVTCGGTFDAALGRYTHNVIVYATSVDPLG